MKTETQIARKKKRKFSWLYFLLLLFMFLIGIVCGIALGIKTGQMMLFEGMGVALAASNINITIDLNETTIIEGVREITEDVIVPILNRTIEKDDF